MIKVSHKDNCISVKGHAYYAKPGEDVVCAGVSALVFALIESLDALTPDEIEYLILAKGNIEIKHGNLSESAKLLIDSFFIGVKLIADKHPDNVKIIKTF